MHELARAVIVERKLTELTDYSFVLKPDFVPPLTERI
jgi:hypothetical protein